MKFVKIDVLKVMYNNNEDKTVSGSVFIFSFIKFVPLERKNILFTLKR